MRREGVQVRARSGFFYRNPLHDPEEARRADENTALRSNVDFTSLPISGTWQQVEPAGDKRKAHFVLSVPPGVIAVDEENENQVSIDFLVVALDASGKESARVSQRLERKLPPPGASQLLSQGLGYANTLILPPGQYSVHFVIRDNLRGAIGSVITPGNWAPQPEATSRKVLPCSLVTISDELPKKR